jgi:hypothetical protein
VGRGGVTHGGASRERSWADDRAEEVPQREPPKRPGEESRQSEPPNGAVAGPRKVGPRGSSSDGGEAGGGAKVEKVRHLGCVDGFARAGRLAGVGNSVTLPLGKG